MRRADVDRSYALTPSHSPSHALPNPPTPTTDKASAGRDIPIEVHQQQPTDKPFPHQEQSGLHSTFSGGVLINIGLGILIEWLWVVPRVRMTPQSHMLVLAMTLFSLVYGMVNNAQIRSENAEIDFRVQE